MFKVERFSWEYQVPWGGFSQSFSLVSMLHLDTLRCWWQWHTQENSSCVWCWVYYLVMEFSIRGPRWLRALTLAAPRKQLWLRPREKNKWQLTFEWVCEINTVSKHNGPTRFSNPGFGKKLILSSSAAETDWQMWHRNLYLYRIYSPPSSHNLLNPSHVLATWIVDHGRNKTIPGRSSHHPYQILHSSGF